MPIGKESYGHTDTSPVGKTITQKKGMGKVAAVKKSVSDRVREKIMMGYPKVSPSRNKLPKPKKGGKTPYPREKLLWEIGK